MLKNVSVCLLFVHERGRKVYKLANVENDLRELKEQVQLRYRMYTNNTN